MVFGSKARVAAALFSVLASGWLIIGQVASSAQSNGASTTTAEKTADPWSQAEIVHADHVVQELGAAKGETALTIVYVGFHTLYAGGRIPNAFFHGTASTEKGLAEFKAWAEALPRSSNLIIYCGCCPFERCPNIRPAYKALHEMGFTRVRVLVLPTSFAVDWVGKGYPIQKGQ
jgi:thiosulfate/3-mercaptopyruvate sulfurtransferase